MKTSKIEKLLRKVLNESLHEKAEELKSKIETNEWNQQVTLSSSPSDIHEDDYDEQSCKYHMDKFGPDDPETMKHCKKREGEIEEKLYGGQKKLDKNKNNKIDAEDFKMLRKTKGEMDESKDICSECGGMMYEGECSECGAKMYEEMGEQEQEEGNAFTGALANAKKHGKKSFEVDGEEYPVTEGKEKWIQKTGMKKGALHKKLGVPEGEKLSQSKLKSIKKELMKKGEGDKKLSKEDAKLLKQVNLALTLKDVKESTKESLVLTESELIDLIEAIVLEDKKHKGLAGTEKVQKMSKKENDDYIKSVTKKMKEYLKDGSKGEYSSEPKVFPKGNGELANMDKKAYKASDAVEEYVDAFAYPGQTNITFDEIKPNDEQIERYLKGDSKSGNSQEYANAVKSDVGEKFMKNYEDNIYGAEQKSASYKRYPQPVDDAGEKTLGGDLKSKKGAKKAKEILNKVDESAPKEEKVLNEEFEKMKRLISYNKKTQ